jgi:hypothetical protein
MPHSNHVRDPFCQIKFFRRTHPSEITFRVCRAIGATRNQLCENEWRRPSNNTLSRREGIGPMRNPIKEFGCLKCANRKNWGQSWSAAKRPKRAFWDLRRERSMAWAEKLWDRHQFPTHYECEFWSLTIEIMMWIFQNSQKRLIIIKSCRLRMKLRIWLIFDVLAWLLRWVLCLQER